MTSTDLDIIVHGIDCLAVVAAAWSLLFFGKIKLSSPPARASRQRREQAAGDRAQDTAPERRLGAA